MIWHKETGSRELGAAVRAGKIKYGGNARLKIYGRLNCSSGKRMKNENRVFFESETEARALGFRPCGNCMKRIRENFRSAVQR